MARSIKSVIKFQRFLSNSNNLISSIINPLELRADHVSHTYCVPHSEMKSFFSQCLPRSLNKQGDTIGKTCWILREQSWKIMQQLRDKATPPKRYLLYGPDKSGKTVAMLQVIHHCLHDQWIVVHIPSVFSWVHPKSESKPSKQPGTYDVPNESCSWLQHFRAMNSKHLGQIKLSRSYSWTKKEKSAEGDSILKAIEQGIIRPNIATDVILCVLNELSQLKSHKVLLAVDDFNGCFVPKCFKLNENEWIRADQISFVRHLLQYIDPINFRGPVVAALSKRQLRNQHFGTYFYDHLLGPQGVELTNDFEIMKVPDFTESEAKECLEFYNHEKLFSKNINPKIFNELWHLSSGNPGELDRLCRSV